MSFAIHLFVLGINQTLLLALLPQLASLLGFGSDANNWGLLILVMNLNLITYWFGSGWWGKAISHIGLNRSAQIASLGLIVSTIAFVAMIFFIPSWLIFIALARLATGCFTSAFLPIAQAHAIQSQSFGDTGIAKLSKLSSYITIGRFIGPILVMLPVPMSLLLLSPAFIILLAQVRTGFASTPKLKYSSVAPSLKEPTLKVFKTIAPSGLAAALLTTALVAIVQLILLPFITQLGYSEQQASEYYAQLLLFISCLVILFQRWVLPELAKRDTQQNWYHWLLLCVLYAGSSILAFISTGWLSLLLGLSLLAFSIAGLPAWYTHKLMQHHQNVLPHGQISGATAQAHTLGHLLGTALAAAALSTNISINYLLLPTSVLLSLCIVLLAKKQLTKVSATAPLEEIEVAEPDLNHQQTLNSRNK